MKTILNYLGLIAISCTFLTSAHAQVGSITTASTSCSLIISSCEGDTLTLTPQDQASYTNYKWYFGSVAPANEITAGNAASHNVVATNFAGNLPIIKVVSGGGTYILTGEYATPSGCATLNDTFQLNFTPRPLANNATLTLCEATTGSGTADFTLTNADATVTGGAAGVAVTYHTTLADAQGDANPLSSPSNSVAKTLYARVENTTTGCYRTAMVTLTVNPLPTVTDPSDQVVCNGVNTTAITFGGSAVTGTTYSWTNNTTSIGLAASGTGDIAAFAATNATSSPVTATITVTPTANSCSGTPQTFTITVNPTPSVTDPSDQVVCNSANTTAITFGGSAVTGTTYSWTNNTTSIGLAASGTGDIAAFTATNATSSPITATITVTPTANSCSGTPQTFTITVNPLPNFTLVKPTACPGTTEEVNITSLTNVNTATSQLKIDAGAYTAYPSPATVTGLSTGSHTLTIKNENGCETAKSITISPVSARICLPVTVTRSIGNN